MAFQIILTIILGILHLPETNFQGIIEYNKYSEERLVGKETHYYGKNKFRVDIETYYSDTILKSSKIYLLQEQPFNVYVKQNETYTKLPFKGIENISRYKSFENNDQKICDFICQAEMLTCEKFWGFSYKIELVQQIWTAHELNYIIPHPCPIPPEIMVSENSKLALQINESAITALNKKYSTKKIASSIAASELHEDYFKID